jgi:hypothetical protein
VPHFLVPQVKVVMLLQKAQIEYPSFQLLVLSPGSALTFIGFERIGYDT